MTDESDFAEFVRSRAPALYRYGYLLTGSAHDADDLVQEALIRLRAAWPKVRRQDNPVGYTRTTMARLHVSMWRRRRRESATPAVPETGAEDPGYALVDGHAAVWQALATLPARQRAVMVLRYYENLSDAEIAETLGISRGTVRSQVFRALAKLRATPFLESIPGVM